MITANTLRRFAAAAIAAGAIVTTSAASATGDFRGFDRSGATPAKTTPANTNPGSGIPGFKNPLAPKTTPATRQAVDPRRVFVGTWKVALKNGKYIAVKFAANGRFYLVHSDRRQVIEVGFWKVQNKRLMMLPVGECLRKNMKRCRKFDRRKRVQVAFRIVNRNRVEAPAGTFIRRRAA